MSYYVIKLYSGAEHPALNPVRTTSANTEREARRIAARLLGHRTLRGASSWERYQGGTVYQFGPHDEENGYDFVVVEVSK